MRNSKTMRLKVLTAVIAIFISSTLFAQVSVQNEVSNYYNDAKQLQPAIVGIKAVDIATDSVIVDLNSKKGLIPASIVKLYTTATALHYLGPDFTYKTYITHNGTVDSKGVLEGDIIVHGSGDPTLGSKYLSENKYFLDTIVKMILDKGITKITGQLIIDCSIFDSQAIPTSWVWEDLGKSYAAGVYPVSINDNSFSISFSSPQDEDTLKKARPSAPAINASPFEQSLDVESIEKDEKRGNFVVRGAIPAPQEIVGIELVQRFIENGLFDYKQDYMPGVVPVRGIKDTLGVIVSPELRKIVEQTNHKSLNNYAEHICKYLGYSLYKDGSYSVGTKVVEDYFDTLHMTNDFVNLYDGSGLSRYNLTSAAHMTEFLSILYKDGGTESDFYKSLPVSNESGTLRGYGFPADMQGKIHAKTGSMTRVRNMAGYMTTQSGKTIAFTVMINGFDCSAKESRKLVVNMLKFMYYNY